MDGLICNGSEIYDCPCEDCLSKLDRIRRSNPDLQPDRYRPMSTARKGYDGAWVDDNRAYWRILNGGSY